MLADGEISILHTWYNDKDEQRLDIWVAVWHYYIGVCVMFCGNYPLTNVLASTAAGQNWKDKNINIKTLLLSLLCWPQLSSGNHQIISKLSGCWWQIVTECFLISIMYSRSEKCGLTHQGPISIERMMFRTEFSSYSRDKIIIQSVISALYSMKSGVSETVFVQWVLTV